MEVEAGAVRKRVAACDDSTSPTTPTDVVLLLVVLVELFLAKVVEIFLVLVALTGPLPSTLKEEGQRHC